MEAAVSRGWRAALSSVLVLALVACGRSKPPPTESGSDGGPDGATLSETGEDDDASAPGDATASETEDGASTMDAAGQPDGVSDYGPCPLSVMNGAPCVPGAPTCVPVVCKECLGGYWQLVMLGSVPTCACTNATWTCFSPPAQTIIGDCVVEEPLDCPMAQNVYTDATCSEHPGCAP